MVRLAVVLLLSACATQTTPSHLLASGPTVSDTEVTADPTPLAVESIPTQVLRDPVARQELGERMRRQILEKTHRIPEGRYRAVVRGQIDRQLQQAGLPAADAAAILADVDLARR